jgi:hypothetical protein
MLHIIFWGFVVFGIGYVIGWHTHTQKIHHQKEVWVV